jgi:hypothetical protein
MGNLLLLQKIKDSVKTIDTSDEFLRQALAGHRRSPGKGEAPSESGLPALPRL